MVSSLDQKVSTIRSGREHDFIWLCIESSEQFGINRVLTEPASRGDNMMVDRVILDED